MNVLDYIAKGIKVGNNVNVAYPLTLRWENSMHYPGGSDVIKGLLQVEDKIKATDPKGLAGFKDGKIGQ